MRRAARQGLSLALAALTLCAACATGGGAPPSREEATRQLYERNCAACHGPRGEGRQIGTLAVPPLREGRALTDPDSRILTQIRDGGNGMPPFKYSLDDEQIETLFRFVRTELQGRPAPAGTGGPPGR
jgi:mono/diheme cytochrome c family protein